MKDIPKDTRHSIELPRTMNDKEILAMNQYHSNAELIVACRDLGYLQGTILDTTYGLGCFWKLWRPIELTSCDIDQNKGVIPADFTKLPFKDGAFNTVVFDPPYKLNGTPSCSSDGRYGTNTPIHWKERMALCRAGVIECSRVTNNYLLVKCQDQVVSGKVCWQTHQFANVAESVGCSLVDSLHLKIHRPQPKGRRQVHARRNYSTLMVFKRNRLIKS